MLLFSVKFSKRFLKKLLVIHHKKEKKRVKDIIFFSWIAFVIIVIPLDLIEKVINVRYLLPKFVIQRKKLVGRN